MELRKAAQQALEAMDCTFWAVSDQATNEEVEIYYAAMQTLRAALAEATISKMETVEPVAWNEYPIDIDTTRGPMLMTVGDTLARAGFIKKPKPLTDEAIHDCFQQKHKDKVIERRMIARAIERAHGIGGEE